MIDVRVTGSTHSFAVVFDTITNGAPGPATLKVYSVAGDLLTTIADSSLIDAACGVADVALPSGQDEILTMHVEHTPAAGITAATDARILSAWNGRTGAALWSTTLFSTTEGSDSDPNNPPNCAAIGDASTPWTANNVADSLTVTTNGQWGVFAYRDTGAGGGCLGNCSYAANGGPWIVDLATGQVRADPTALIATGNYVLNVQIDTNDLPHQASQVSVTDPGTGRTVVATTGGAVLDLGLRISDDDSQHLPYAITPDGTRLFAANSTGKQLVSYSLPWLSLGPATPFPPQTGAWDQNFTGQTKTFLEPSTHVVAVSDSQGVVVGFPTKGGPAWHVAADDLCGAVNGQVLVLVHNQLAALDALSGGQIRYNPAPNNMCPIILPSGAGFDGLNFTQDL